MIKNLLTSTKKKSDLGLFLLFILSSVSAFLYPLARFSKVCIARDWGLFNSMSLFANSSWNHYSKVPIHNPYVLGGMDNLANPQTKVFSPLAIFDLLFSAPMANLLSLVCLGVIGSYGMYKLLSYLKVSKTVSIIVSIIFIHASWFHLHFAEGHIIFGSFLLYGFVLLSILRIEEIKYKLLFTLLCAFFLLDGGMYAFIYSLLLLLFLLLFQVNGISFRKLFISIRQNAIYTLLCVLVFLGISSLKLIPLLLLHGNRAPVLENITLNLKSVFTLFFNPNAHIGLTVPGTNYKEVINFHEVGTYIGLIAMIVIVYYLFKNRTKNTLGYFLMILLFLWIGTGWLDPINPWRLFQKLPILNNAHIQTRALFVVYCFLVILLAFGLDQLAKHKKKLFYFVSILLILEGLWLSNYPYFRVYRYEGSTLSTANFPKGIYNTKIDTTFSNPNAYGWGFDFEHYNRKNAATKTFMDPSSKEIFVKAFDEEGYKGEIYLLDGKGTASVNKFIPGEIEIKYDLTENSKIQVNTNYLLGWKTADNKVSAFEENGLLTLKIPEGSGNVTLNYFPKYLILCAILSVLGLLLTILLFYSDFRRKKKLIALKG